MSRWTAERKDELRRLYKSKTAPELAVHFGTTKQAIYMQANKMGLQKDQPNKIKLTWQQEAWLRSNFPHISTGICAMILRISPRTVVRYARRMGLVKTEKFMRECQAYTAKRAKESHIKNGTYPAKGYYSPNLQKGAQYQFQTGVKHPITQK